MPKVSYNKPKKTPKKSTIEQLSCSMCGRLKRPTEFYQSWNPLHKTEKMPYCKECLKASCLDDQGNIDVEKTKKMLQSIDRPFIYELFKASAEDKMDTIGCYMKNLAMPQNRYLGWDASVFTAISTYDNAPKEIIEYNFPPDVLERWKGYPLEDVVSLEDFYSKMQDDNRIESVQDKIYLKKLAIINLEQDKAAKERNWGMFDKLGTMFSKFMQDSKLRAQDRSESDRTGGIRNFCSIYSELEKDDFIPPWEHYRKIYGLTQDIIDKTIMHIENFNLRLNKHERMSVPPYDTPKAENFEIDIEHADNYVDISLHVDEEDVI